MRLPFEFELEIALREQHPAGETLPPLFPQRDTIHADTRVKEYLELQLPAARMKQMALSAAGCVCFPQADMREWTNSCYLPTYTPELGSSSWPTDVPELGVLLKERESVTVRASGAGVVVGRRPRSPLDYSQSVIFRRAVSERDIEVG
jgi:hypothetical protein